MKTKLLIRRRIGNRLLLVGLALALLLLVEFVLGEALVARFGQVTAAQTEEVQAPTLSLGDVLAAIR